MANYSILINTCDKFEDCWVPYFKLHAQYWTNCDGRLFLNTETKDFSYPNLEIVSIKVNGDELAGRLTWSECILRALDKIDDDIVLYMQEDYFIKAPVENDLVEKYVQLMSGDHSIDCIHLTDQAVINEGQSKYDGLYKVKVKQRYRISCQAALWRKAVLKSYLRAHESAWQFEEFGSKRSVKMNHDFYVVDPTVVKLDQFEIIPYVFTGIVQGRWKEEVVPLFAKHGIAIDFKKRGFLEDAPRRSLGLKIDTFRKRLPAALNSYLDLYLNTNADIRTLNNK
ncbi:MAG: hypothetical protein HOO97_01070 [Sideroxydans sp.]|nr:hypothetical protein [Sideroxydans sp.]